MAKVAPHSETVQAAKALQELTRKLATEPEKFSSAVVAINKALCEVRNYLKYRRGGGERNDEMENRLSALWNDVAEQIHPYDRELAYLCMVKGHGWADESVWAMPKYKNLPIKLDQMLHRLQRSQSPTPAPDLIPTKEDQSGNRVDRWISAAKDNPVTAILIFVAILLGGVASVSESLRSIVKPIYSSIPDEAPLLTRLDTENLLQSNRGNIERCLATHEQKFFFLDFVFTQGPGHSIDVDIFPGEEVQPEIEFMHPALKKKEVELFGGHEALQKLSAHKSAKLGVVAPDLNGCIIRAISYRVKNFKLETWEQGFIHRYITDEGS